MFPGDGDGGLPPEERGGLRSWVRRHPWIWIIVLYAFVLGVNVVMAVIALMNQPTYLR